MTETGGRGCTTTRRQPPPRPSPSLPFRFPRPFAEGECGVRARGRARPAEEGRERARGRGSERARAMGAPDCGSLPDPAARPGAGPEDKRLPSASAAAARRAEGVSASR